MPISEANHKIIKSILEKKPEASQPQTNASSMKSEKPLKPASMEPVPLKPIPGLSKATTMNVGEVLVQKRIRSGQAPQAPHQRKEGDTESSVPSHEAKKKSVRAQPPEN